MRPRTKPDYPWFLQSEYRVVLPVGECVVPETARERELFERYGLTPEQILWYRRKVAEKGQALTDQEYPSDIETCFLASGRLFFDRDATARLLAESRPPIDVRDEGRFRIYARPEFGATYLLAVDTAEGIVKATVRDRRGIRTIVDSSCHDETIEILDVPRCIDRSGKSLPGS